MHNFIIYERGRIFNMCALNFCINCVEIAILIVWYRYVNPFQVPKVTMGEFNDTITYVSMIAILFCPAFYQILSLMGVEMEFNSFNQGL